MRILKWLGGGSEDETPRRGLLSARREWHATGIGLSVGCIIAIVGGKDAAWLFIILTAIAVGGREVDVSHLKHVKYEPAYALVSAMIAFLLTAFLVVPNLPNGIV